MHYTCETTRQISDRFGEHRRAVEKVLCEQPPVSSLCYQTLSKVICIIGLTFNLHFKGMKIATSMSINIFRFLEIKTNRLKLNFPSNIGLSGVG